VKEAIYLNWACGSADVVSGQLERAISKVALAALTTHDLKQRLQAAQLELNAECRVVEVGGPTIVNDFLRADLALSAVLPCRISVYDQSGKVWLAMLRPTALLEALGKAELIPAAERLERALIGAIEHVCGWSRRSETLGAWNMC
jgi:uncharacterized protein (DUF302 family)